MIHYAKASNFFVVSQTFYLLRSSQQHFKWCEIDRLAGRILVHCCRAHCTGEQKSQHVASPSTCAGGWSVLGKKKGNKHIIPEKSRSFWEFPAVTLPWKQGLRLDFSYLLSTIIAIHCILSYFPMCLWNWGHQNYTRPMDSTEECKNPISCSASYALASPAQEMACFCCCRRLLLTQICRAAFLLLRNHSGSWFQWQVHSNMHRSTWE